MQKNYIGENSKTTTHNPLTACTTARNNDEGNSGKNRNKTNKYLLPLLPQQIFSSDLVVVLPQALTASQLFGIECTTSIKLEATSSFHELNTGSSIYSICKAFTRWLALMRGGSYPSGSSCLWLWIWLQCWQFTQGDEDKCWTVQSCGSTLFCVA